MRLAENLSKLKNAAGFTIPELADYTGLSRTTVKRVLSHRASPNAEYTPTFKTVRSIAKSLGVTADAVYKQRLEIQVVV